MTQQHAKHFRSIALFAHNEQDAIKEAIIAIRQAGLAPQDQLFVLINGCTDRTREIVVKEASVDARIIPIVIDMGDKANAWNVYVHLHADPKAAMHIFIDGDVKISVNAFKRMDQMWLEHPEALALSTMPRGGRQAEKWSRRIVQNHGMPGNFYALSNTLMSRMKAKIWLPVGFMGDDTLLRWLILRDLNPTAVPSKNRIRPIPDVFFDYSSFSRTTLTGLRRLWRRHLGYTRREIQFNVIKQFLIEHGVELMPLRITETYSKINPLLDAVRASVGFAGRRLLIPFVGYKMRFNKSVTYAQGTAWFEQTK